MQTLLNEINPLLLLFIIYGYIIYMLFFNYTSPLMKWLDKWCKGDNNENNT